MQEIPVQNEHWSRKGSLKINSHEAIIIAKFMYDSTKNDSDSFSIFRKWAEQVFMLQHAKGQDKSFLHVTLAYGFDTLIQEQTKAYNHAVDKGLLGTESKQWHFNQSNRYALGATMCGA